MTPLKRHVGQSGPARMLSIVIAIGISFLGLEVAQTASEDEIPQQVESAREAQKEEHEGTALQEQAIRELRKSGFDVFRMDENEDLETPPEQLTRNNAEIAVDALKPVKHLPSLRVVFLTKCKITDGHLRHLSALKEIETLGLGTNHITDKGLSHLKDMRKLEVVGLSDNQIQGEGLKHLAKHNQLRQLYLHGNPIVDEHLIHISKLENLEMLGLGRTKVTDKGLKHLADLKKLTYIGLFGSQVSDKAALELQQQFPTCKVEHAATLGIP